MTIQERTENVNWLKEVLSGCPKGEKALIKWYRHWISQIQGMLVAPGENFESEPLPEDLLQRGMYTTLATNPRQLYDFFDGHQIYAWPVWLLSKLDDATSGYWGYEVRTTSRMDDEDQEYTFRIEAERAGFARAFKFLEEQL